MQYPVYSGFLVKASKEQSAALTSISLAYRNQQLEQCKQQVKKAQKRGELRKDIPTDWLVFWLVQMENSALDYLIRKYEIDFQKHIQEQKPITQIKQKNLEKMAQNFVKILKAGIDA